MLDYLVVYESETGNTKKIATEIFSALPGMSKDLINIHERDTIPEAHTYFVGFCVHRGTCSIEIGNLLGSLSSKAVALFATCGADNSREYFHQIENSARIWLEDDNLYLGGFVCQGKMPLPVRQKYENMLHQGSACPDEQLQRQLQNFDEAMIHPDKSDCCHAKDFVDECLQKIPE